MSPIRHKMGDLVRVNKLQIKIAAGVLARAFLAWLVSGVSIERAQEIWDWVLENETLPHLRSEVQATLDDHKGRGHRVILLSGSFTPLLDALAIRLEVESAIGTPLANKKGCYPARSSRP